MSEGNDVDRVRRAVLAVLPGLVFAGEARGQDAAVVQARAYKVAFENDQVRVLEFNSKPGMGICGNGVHSHPPHLVVALSPAKVRVKLADGKQFVAENKLGDVFWDPGGVHETENIYGRNIRALIVELKSGKA